MTDDIHEEAQKRRTFAIISHPDAGKTTLTEKLLLYAGAIHLAGSVKSRKASRHAVSDWMKMEQERGISITSSVLQFNYLSKALNLLDTPGHADFSEDTYRTLSAVDSAIMLIDHAKGIENRTLKLFEVCRLRQLPVITLMNKLDREGLHPLALLDEVSKTLHLKVYPINWPIGMGRNFQGVVRRSDRMVTLYQNQEHGNKEATFQHITWQKAAKLLPANLYEEIDEELQLLDTMDENFDAQAFMAGKLSPVFWGSAMSNFGVEPLLEFLALHTSPPRARQTEDEQTVEPTDAFFSGFIFKIQANMNPKHRDRMAFMRVVSGRFERGMAAILGRDGSSIRLSKPHSFLAQERSIVDVAYPGDIVGLYDPGELRIGDTLSNAPKSFQFAGIPRFAPEFFAKLLLQDPLRRKALDTGLSQLAHEGIIQLFQGPQNMSSETVLGAVGMLQFDVLIERLKNEYRVETTLHYLPYKMARWVAGDESGLMWLKERRDYPLLQDRHGRWVVLLSSPWLLQYALKNAAGLLLLDVEPLA